MKVLQVSFVAFLALACSGKDDPPSGVVKGTGGAGSLGGAPGDGDGDGGGASPGDGDGDGDGDISMGTSCDGVTCPQGANAECVVMGDAGVCRCRVGYFGESCQDIDECATTNGQCPDNSTCVNFPGSLACHCHGGFVDTGVSCDDIDECTSGQNSCGAGANCVDTEGGYECNCGLDAGDGYFCKESSDCLDSACQDSDGLCWETVGGFACRCPVGFAGVDCATECGDSVLFPDAELEAAIRSAVGVPTGDISGTDLEFLTSLTVPAATTSLVGLECAPFLESLNLTDSAVADLAPIEHLGGLRHLNISCSEVTSLAPIANLITLEDLQARAGDACVTTTTLTDLSGIEDLLGLTELNLFGQGLSDIDGLAGLGRLASLDLGYNQIDDLSPLSGLYELEVLFLDNNQVSSLGDLGDLPRLSQVGAFGNQISSLGSLSGATALVRLELGENDFINTDSFQELSSLGVLNLASNQITDVSGLAPLIHLSDVNLSRNQIESFSALLEEEMFGTFGQMNITGNPCAGDEDNLADLASRGVKIVGACAE